MGLRYEIASPVIRFVTTGDVEYADGLQVMRRALREAAAGGAAGTRWGLFFDIRQSTENRGSDDLRGIADLLSEHRGILSGRCAVLAGDPLHYGLARMFCAFAEGLGFEAEAFLCPDEANRWLWGNNPADGAPAGAPGPPPC